MVPHHELTTRTNPAFSRARYGRAGKLHRCMAASQQALVRIGSGQDVCGQSALPQRRAKVGHDPPFGPQVALPLERPLHLGCCQSVSSLSFLSKVRQEAPARTRAVAGRDVRTSDKRVHFV